MCRKLGKKHDRYIDVANAEREASNRKDRLGRPSSALYSAKILSEQTLLRDKMWEHSEPYGWYCIPTEAKRKRYNKLAMYHNRSLNGRKKASFGVETSHRDIQKPHNDKIRYGFDHGDVQAEVSPGLIDLGYRAALDGSILKLPWAEGSDELIGAVDKERQDINEITDPPTDFSKDELELMYPVNMELLPGTEKSQTESEPDYPMVDVYRASE